MLDLIIYFVFFDHKHKSLQILTRFRFILLLFMYY